LPNCRKEKRNTSWKGASYDEREHRFGEVVQANHAEWKGKIASTCAATAMSAPDDEDNAAMN